MLILATTTDKLELTRSSAADIDVNAEFVDFDGVDGTPGCEDATFNSAATGDIVSAPGSNIQRNVKSLTVKNRHASLACAVTPQKDRNGTNRQYLTANLQPGETLEYTDAGGWKVLDANGSIKITYTDNRLLTKALGSTQSNSTTTPTEVSGLTMPLAIGTYAFEYRLIMQSGATTTGWRLSVDFSGTAGDLAYMVEVPTSLSTAADANADGDVVTATGGLNSLFVARAGSQAGLSTTLSVDTANADTIVIIRGIINVTAAGNIRLWHGSEVAAASSVMLNSSLVLVRTNA